MFWKRVRLTLEMIKFEHSVFALPFALTGALLAVRQSDLDRRTLWVKIAWIVMAMVGARSAAMAFNRLVDAEIDGRNPHTRMRHIPSGVLSTTFGWCFVAVSSLISLGVVFCHSFTKRFTTFSHLVLGFALGIAPAAAGSRCAGRSIRAFCGSPRR